MNPTSEENTESAATAQSVGATPPPTPTDCSVASSLEEEHSDPNAEKKRKAPSEASEGSGDANPASTSEAGPPEAKKCRSELPDGGDSSETASEQKQQQEEEEESSNPCQECGKDMGGCNPRQLCGKTSCSTPTEDVDVSAYIS